MLNVFNRQQACWINTNSKWRNRKWYDMKMDLNDIQLSPKTGVKTMILSFKNIGFWRSAIYFVSFSSGSARHFGNFRTFGCSFSFENVLINTHFQCALTNDIFMVEKMWMENDALVCLHNFRSKISFRHWSHLLLFVIYTLTPTYTSIHFSTFWKIIVYTMCLMHLLKFQVKFNFGK